MPEGVEAKRIEAALEKMLTKLEGQNDSQRDMELRLTKGQHELSTKLTDTFTEFKVKYASEFSSLKTRVMIGWAIGAALLSTLIVLAAKHW